VIPRSSGCVAIIDDDESVRESVADLLRAFGYGVRAFASAEAFLASDMVAAASGLILDVAMPGMTGPELFEHLIEEGATDIRVIFITAHGNSELCRRLISLGAAGCLQKPFDPKALVDALREALA
jgi:FixJ family two-component response regulator